MAQSTTKQPTKTQASMCDQLSQEFTTECAEVREDFQELVENVGSSVAQYCRKRPLVAGLTVFAMGFYLGWKVKPW